MHRIILAFALVFGAATLGAGLYDLFGPAARSGLFHTGGELWFVISPNTLNLMQAVTQRYLTPSLWDPTIVSVLKLPAVASLGGLAAFFALIWIMVGRRQA